MTLPTDYIDGDVLTAADVNAITTAVNSNTDLKLAVGTFNAKGDLLVGLTNDSVGVLSVGTNGYLLSASSGATSGLQWIAAGGKLLGSASATDTTQRSTNSLSATDITGLSVTYTPVSASSTLLVTLCLGVNIYLTSGSSLVRYAAVQLQEAAASPFVYLGRVQSGIANSDPANSYHQVSFTVPYASNGTTARTWKGQFYTTTTDVTIFAENNRGAYIHVMEIGA